MLHKFEEGTRYIHWEQFKSALVLNAFSAGSGRRDERESHPGGETMYTLDQWYATLNV